MGGYAGFCGMMGDCQGMMALYINGSWNFYGKINEHHLQMVNFHCHLLITRGIQWMILECSNPQKNEDKYLGKLENMSQTSSKYHPGNTFRSFLG